MLTVAFAFVVATALFFCFRQTRWMGVVGVFVLLCISPLFFSFVLLLAGVAYWLLFAKSNSPSLQGTSKLPTTDNRRGRSAVVWLGLLGIGALALGSRSTGPESSPSRAMSAVRSSVSDEMIVLRTPGGLLEVSRIHATELLDSRVTHKLLGIEIGELVPRIRVPAVYRYHIELAPEWRVLKTGREFTVVAPKVRPSLPVAVDFAGIEKDVAGTWILLPWKGAEDLRLLERSISDKLAEKAMSADYLSRQRMAARETVREFVSKWLVEQTGWKDTRNEEIHVLFADEPVGSGDWPSG